MSHNLQTLRVFIASPSDLNDERKAMRDVADSLNATFGREANLHIQLLGWEDTLPGIGRPQDLINEDVDKADLFIGFLWRWWGSSPGHQEYSSGFEEEFYRALKRKEKTGSPQISVFFKQVEVAALNDPGEHLKKILEFKSGLIQSKELLFREFKDITDWKEQTRDLLVSHLLRLMNRTSAQVTQTHAQQPLEQKPTDEEQILGSQGKTVEIAREEVSRLWNEAGNAIKNGELSVYSRSSKTLDSFKIARLGLATASIINRDIESSLLGVHLINLLFKHRRNVSLNRIEELLVLRTNLGNTYDLAPGWFWLQTFSLNLRGFIPFLAYSDRDVRVRLAAIHLATVMDWPLRSHSRNSTNTIKRICSHEDAATRKAGLEYLALKGTIKDLPLAENAVKDPDNSVRAQADKTVREILLRQDASAYFKKYILNIAYINDDTISAVVEYSPKIGAEVLKSATQHPNEKIRISAAKSLAARGSISAEEITDLKILDSGEIWQAYYEERINAGVMFAPNEIRKNLRSNLLGINLLSPSNVDEKKVILALFRRLSYEELLSYVDFRSEDGAMAYSVLAEMHFVKFCGKLRSDIEDNFQSLERASKIPEPSILDAVFSYSQTLRDTSAKANFLTAALNGFALHAQSADREFILRFLKHESSQIRVAAIRGLGRAGIPIDTEFLLGVAENGTGEEAIEAARVALALSPGEDGAASVLLQSRKPELFKLALSGLLNCASRRIWKRISGRLRDEDEDIRKLICAYAVIRFRVKELEKILDAYLSEDRYFYNVIFYLDRAIYAKMPLRKVFRKEISEFLK